MSIPASREWCSTCVQVFQPTQARNHDRDFEPKGQTLEGFRKAATTCFICSSIWKHHERSTDSWVNSHGWETVDEDSWKPMTFRIHRTDSDSGLPTFNVDVWHSVPATDHQDEVTWGVNIFQMLHLDDSRYRSLFTFPRFDDNTGSPRTLDVAYSWFQDCLSSHQKCRNLPTMTPHWLPTRLVDVGLSGDAEWKLCITSEDLASQPPAPRYMTLSYRWGVGQQLLLLGSTLNTFRRGGSLISELPKTFQDLVAVARRFGVRYLWIDCLCIIQDSTDDWEAEAPMMRQVYANSACNVAASASNDPDGGLFRAREPRDDHEPGIVSTTLAASSPEQYFIFEEDYYISHMYRKRETLHTRGWVFQETFLAPRLLHFAGSQLLWECHETDKCEGFPHGIPFHESTKNLDRLMAASDETKKRLSEEPHCRNSNRLGDETLSLWQDVMSHYGYRQFTRPSDKLYAISGVAKLFQEVTGQEYLAGLWRSRILEQLDWYVEEPTAASATYRAPSWSWASIDGEVSNFTWDPAHQLLVELLDADVATKGADPTVNVTGGFLKLNGTVIAGSYQRHPLSYEQLHVKPRNEQFEPMTVLSPLPDTSGHLVEDTGELYLLPIKWRKTSDMQLLGEDRDFYSIKCLLLAPVSIPDNIYKRIGCFESPEEGLLQALKSDTIERTVITLV
ncbi:heterokaryon incompatibility protein [Colletotrichum truncatum]|uniref:Heterokaryon incompatibility protein n=1 Tax=Colletotrichum truncatum TaxID=5467 RepID=A0ACC3YGN7_COLTU